MSTVTPAHGSKHAPSQWLKTSLGQLVDNGDGCIQTGPFGSQLHAHDYVDEGVPVVMPQQLGDNLIDTGGIARITEEDRDRLSRHIMHEGDIVFSRRGDVTRRAYITANEDGWLCGTGCLLLRLKHSNCDNRYLVRFLGLHETRSYLTQHAVGATMPNLNQKILASVPVQLPPRAKQERVVQIVSAYDELIENNRRRIQLLEQAARLLYKEWFVHLRFPGHEHVKIKAYPGHRSGDGVPEGWERKPMLDVWDISYGKNLPTKHITSTGKYPVHGADGIIGYHTEKNVDSSLCLVTCRGNGSGNVRRTFGPTFVTNNCFVLRPNYKADVLKFHYAIMAMEFLKLRELRTGAAQPQLTLAGINHLQVIVPSNSILTLYNSLTDPLFDQADCLRKQNEQLTQARDLLLPRLMNGEVAV